MPRANLPTPDDIAGQRSFSTPYTDLKAAVRPQSQFGVATPDNIGQAAQTNSLSQLAGAMEVLNPALGNLGISLHKEAERLSAIQGEADRNGMGLDAARQNYNQLVKSGQLQAGASRAYVDAFNATALDTETKRFQLSLREQYDKLNLKNYDDSSKVMAELQKFTGEWRRGILQAEDGQHKFSALDLANSKFDDKLGNSLNSLVAQHNQYRVEERTRIGKETAQTNAQTSLQQGWAQGKPLFMIAQEMSEPFFDRTTGLANNGLTFKETNELRVDAVITEAVAQGNTEILDVMKYMYTYKDPKTGREAPLMGTQYAKEQIRKAEQQILSAQIQRENWAETQATRKAEREAGLTPDVKAKSAMDGITRATERFNQEQAELDKRHQADDQKLREQSHSGYILNVAEHANPFGPQTQKSWEWLRTHEPNSYRSLTDWLRQSEHAKNTVVETSDMKLRAAELASRMTLQPQSFNAAEVYAAAAAGRIAPDKVNTLLDDYRHISQNMNHPFMRQPEFDLTLKQLNSSVKGDDVNDPVGAGLRQRDATQQLMGLAYGWLKSHPNGNTVDFQKDMRGYMDIIVQSAAPEFAQDARKKSARANNAVVTPPDERTSFEKFMPNALGGKSAPQKQVVPTGPPPMKIGDVVNLMSKEDQSFLEMNMSNPKVPEGNISQLIDLYMWPKFKDNGRDAVEFETFKKDLLARRKAALPKPQ